MATFIVRQLACAPNDGVLMLREVVFEGVPGVTCHEDTHTHTLTNDGANLARITLSGWHDYDGR